MLAPLLLVSILCLNAQASVEQATPQGAVARAQQLRDNGQLAAAAEILRAQLSAHPDDGEAARLLAQTLYWLKDTAAARVVYEAALVRHPEDTTARLEYGRMLVETGQGARARQVLSPLEQVPATQSEAKTLLGSLAYWQGDLSSAKRLFEEALRANPEQKDASRQLLEIAALTASWVRLSSGLRHDDQPLDSVTGGLEAKWFATPLASITVHATPSGYFPSNATSQNLWAADVSVANYAPAARLETEFGAGVLHRSFGTDALDWQGHARVGVRVVPALTIAVRAQRAPYLYTTASLVTPVMTQAAAALVQLNDPRGWLGEAAYERQRYPDANSVRTAYAWLLAPLVHRGGNEFQVGYAFASDDADQSRFVLANPTQRYLPADPRFDLTGRYVPYYTPDNLVSHSAIFALALRASPAATFRLGGSAAFHATDQQPGYFVTGGQVRFGSSLRTFTPWNAHTSVDIALGGALTLGVSAEFGRTAFYKWATAGIALTHRFAGAQR